MALVNVTDIALLNNPARFDSDFQFEVTFHVASQLKADLEWRLVYVGSADNQKHDQVLDTVLVGPLEVGKSRFVFVAPPPNLAKIPSEDLLGVTILMLSASYRGNVFFKVGYYVNNELADPEMAGKRGPLKGVDIARNVLMSNPRVTRNQIEW